MRVVEKTKEIWSKEKENTRKNFLKLRRNLKLRQMLPLELIQMI